MGTGGSDGWRRLHVRKELGRDRSLGLRTASVSGQRQQPQTHTRARAPAHTHAHRRRQYGAHCRIYTGTKTGSLCTCRTPCLPVAANNDPTAATRHSSRHSTPDTRLAHSCRLLNMATVDSAGEYGHGGTGDRLARAVIIVAGVCSLVASLITFVCVPSLIHPHPHPQC
jgi:hypothetical protein